MDRRLPEPNESRLLILKDSHLTEDVLELYSLGRISDESILDPVEQHLLVCGYCQTRLEKLDQFQQATRIACEKARNAPPKPAPRRIQPWAIAAALAAVLLVPASLRNFSAPVEAVTLELAATRSEAQPTAPSGSPLRLQLNLNGMEGVNLVCTLLTISGETLATTPLDAKQAIFQSRPLQPGQYLVRLSDPATGELKREFLFRVQ